MAKQYYFAVCVEEDGTAWIDHDIDVNFGAGNVWEEEAQDWANGWDEANVDGIMQASNRLQNILKGEN